MKFDVIAFDADDTLWHNEIIYDRGRQMFQNFFESILSPQETDQALSSIEIYNIRHYGYGIKSYALSMIEAALELGGDRLQTKQIQEILAFAKEIIHAQIDLMKDVEVVLRDLSADFDLMLVTKGDLFQQELKIGRSGLAGYFDFIEVLSEKTPVDYEKLLGKFGIDPRGFLMVGNSLRSDILPVIEIGGQAIHIPYDSTWTHETILERPLGKDEYYQLDSIGQVPQFIRGLN
ncbi:HAD family hydrolase [Chloroflexota bacterium]